MVLQNGKHVCNVCGETYDSAISLGVHGQVHDKEVITGVLVECEVCGEEERVRPSRAENYVTCSSECLKKQQKKRSEVTCEVCGKTERVENSRAEGYVTCSKECMSKLYTDKTEVACEVCGKTERVRNARAEGYVTCSRECLGKLNTNKTEVTCEVCGKTEKVQQSRAKQYVTCSMECRNEFYTNKKEVVCEVCGKTEKVQQSRAKRYVTCSNECSDKLKSKRKKNSDVSDNIEQIAERYKNGEPASLIAEDYDVCTSTILSRLHERNNLEIRTKNSDVSDNIEQIAERYKDGEPASLIAEDYDVSSHTILSRLHERNDLEVRTKNSGCSIETAKGHDVRSTYELKVANFLYKNDVKYEYEPQMPGPHVPDFAVDGVLIEMWGITGFDEYDERRKEKERWYDANGIEYIGVEPVDLDNLEECLSMFI